MGIRGKAYSENELATLRKHYPKLGGAGMRAAGYLVNRTRNSLTKQANLLGLQCNIRAQVDATPEVVTPLPRMDLMESLACVTFRKWRGPVNRERVLRWAA